MAWRTSHEAGKVPSIEAREKAKSTPLVAIWVLFYILKRVDRFRDSSAVEQPAVNRRVEGSNPSRGA